MFCVATKFLSLPLYLGVGGVRGEEESKKIVMDTWPRRHSGEVQTDKTIMCTQ